MIERIERYDDSNKDLDPVLKERVQVFVTVIMIVYLGIDEEKC